MYHGDWKSSGWIIKYSGRSRKILSKMYMITLCSVVSAYIDLLIPELVKAIIEVINIQMMIVLPHCGNNLMCFPGESMKGSTTNSLL